MNTKIKTIFPLAAVPVVYTVLLWGLGKLGLSSAWSAFVMFPLVLLFSYKVGTLHLSLPKHFDFKNTLLLLFLFASCILFGTLFPAETKDIDLLYIAAACLIAPLDEELLFRAFVLGKGRSRIGPIAVLFLSAALFAAAHSQPIPAFAIGLVLGFTYLKYDSLLIPLLFHIFLNISILLIF